MLAAAEFAARWYVEGSFLEALDSVLGLRTAAEPGATPHLVPDPELGFKLNPEIEGINSLGIRGPEIDLRRPAGTFRILLLGDSITYPKDSWAMYLRQDLAPRCTSPIEVINAAVHGYTTYQERVLLERDLLPLEPDLVIVQYCLNDNYRFLHRITSAGRRLMTLEAKKFLFPDGDGVLEWLTETSYLVYGIRRALLGLRAPDPNAPPWENHMVRAAWSDATWRSQAEHFSSMCRSVRANGGRFVVLAVPLEVQLGVELLRERRQRTLKPQTALAKICRAWEIPFLDIHGAFVARRDRGLYTDGLHLTETGHRLTGRLMADFIERERLAPVR